MTRNHNFHETSAERPCGLVSPARELPENLTVCEVAELLRCSKAHVCNLVNGKVKNALRLPAIRLGRRILISLATLQKWQKANEGGVQSML